MGEYDFVSKDYKKVNNFIKSKKIQYEMYAEFSNCLGESAKEHLKEIASIDRYNNNNKTYTFDHVSLIKRFEEYLIVYMEKYGKELSFFEFLGWPNHIIELLKKN